MKRQSKKRKAEYDAVKQERADYLASWDYCQVCTKTPPCEVHEICRGPARREAVQDSRTWLAVCRSCHERIGNYAVYPLEWQTYLKCLYLNREFFELINAIRQRGPRAIEPEDAAKLLLGLSKRREALGLTGHLDISWGGEF